MNRRGLSPVLGLVLLLGIVAIGSMAIFLAGMSLAEATQSEATHEQAESSMAELAQSGDRIATSETREAEFSVRGADSARVRSIPDAGRINVTVTNRTSGNRIFAFEEDLGALVYEANDGTEVAYQAGGVWRRDGNGGSTVVRSPQFHYRENPDPTITFPITLIRGDYSATGDTDARLVAQRSTNHYPDAPNHFNPLTSGSVMITIESRYCQGWESYFEEYTDGSAAEDCEAGTQDQLVLQFSVPFSLDGLESGVMLGDGNGDPDDYDGIDDSSDFGDSDDAPSATPMVEARLEDARNNGTVLPNDAEIDSPGLYYDDGNLSNGDVTFDTSNGDIEVATDQYPVFDGDVSIEGDGNVTIYTTRNIVDQGGGSERIGEADASSQLRVFVHSDVDQVGHNGQNSDFHGLLYAPNSEVKLFRGNNDGSGALVAESADIGNTVFDIDPDLADMSFYQEFGDAPFYYLHISETEMTVED